MLVFENNDEIDIRGVTTLGVSAKKKDSAIGFFGTGLKYGISILLREGGKITLMQGNTVYIFGKKTIQMRDNQFDVITMQKRGSLEEPIELAFTTELGKNWELWKAYRELYCNTMDEGGTVEVVDRMPRGRKGTTRIVVEGLDEIHEKRGEFLLDTALLWVAGEVAIHAAGDEGGAVFYKGVRVYKPLKEAKFNYNILCKVDLTEDRTLSHPYWAADRNIMYGLLGSDDVEPITEVLTAGEDTFEGSFDWNREYVHKSPSSTFSTVVSTLGKVKANQKAHGYWAGHCLESSSDFARTAMGNNDKRKLAVAVRVAEGFGYGSLFTVIPTDLLGESTLSVAKNKAIYLNHRLLEDGYFTPSDIAKLLVFGELELLGNKDKAIQDILFEKLLEAKDNEVAAGVGDTLALVGDFHKAFGLAVAEEPCVVVPTNEQVTNLMGIRRSIEAAASWAWSCAEADPGFAPYLRMQLMAEELAEVCEALEDGDTKQVLHELADMRYVNDGTALTFGLGGYLMSAITEIHRANLSKLDENGEAIFDKAGRVQKSHLFIPADMSMVMGEVNAPKLDWLDTKEEDVA